MNNGKFPPGNPSRLLALSAAVAAVIGMALPATQAAAQESGARGSSALLEEVIVTARKREEGSQDVPMSISAFNSNQIDALKVRDLTNLAVLEGFRTSLALVDMAWGTVLCTLVSMAGYVAATRLAG